MSAIRAGMQTIADYSGAGRPADDMDLELQEWPISFGPSGHAALYRLQRDMALVVAGRHQKEVGYRPSWVCIKNDLRPVEKGPFWIFESQRVSTLSSIIRHSLDK